MQHLGARDDDRVNPFWNASRGRDHLWAFPHDEMRKPMIVFTPNSRVNPRFGWLPRIGQTDPPKGQVTPLTGRSLPLTTRATDVAPRGGRARARLRSSSNLL